MKFWKILSNLIEQTLPDWRDKFLSYKDLKKLLKLICPKDPENPPTKRPKLNACETEEPKLTKEVNDFSKLLELEIEKFNTFVVEQEEEYIIKWKELQDRVSLAKDSNEELMAVGREIVDFHGEMVLLENYSALNYTGLVKIIKKYDKRTGALTRLPFIQEVLHQPFYKTDVLDKLVKECEMVLRNLFPRSISQQDTCGSTTGNQNNETQTPVPTELAEIEHMENMYTRLTLSALRTLEEIRGGSSTVSIFSLPPLHKKALDEDWNKITALEQAAK
ncbi:hypothetical protein L6164_024310 [Bauhinia variegata]|uniref:Uncharacterized protein n=1 Tax=Bauhinia variegata TaxID=167791 RepID=A0ACB9LXZ6_BAUVA|nr:hypothetical protein L6164_024310 [Bauhinia variegata]